MNHCKKCGYMIPDLARTCEEAGYRLGCMSISEAFEGPNSSLRKTFDEVVNTPPEKRNVIADVTYGNPESSYSRGLRKLAENTPPAHEHSPSGSVETTAEATNLLIKSKSLDTGIQLAKLQTMNTPAHEWREEQTFREKLETIAFAYEEKTGIPVVEEMMDELQNLLNQHSARLVERLEASKVQEESYDTKENTWHKMGYNQALDQATDIVKTSSQP